ncbi:SDR family NAD(P)-dependent oxidoreductase [Hydrocarboniphaga sp.]|uniref:SDR family NAD(P)-dependent oxidoreductase n=1 Tax=Hydrocarboniphaga sp. TaxID=2033016 RepID=UPI003D13EE46
MLLSGKVVAVTGAFGSLGREVVKAAIAAGARVAAIDQAAAPAEPGSLREAAIYGGVDLTDAVSAKASLGKLVSDLGRLDALVNIAGGFRWETLEQGSLDSWDLLYRLNVRTAATAAQAALPHLIKSGAGGRIVNIGAAGAIKAAAGMGAYAASKAGVAKLTEALAEELKNHRITVNALLPSIIDTPPNRQAMPDADYSKWVQPAELAAIIVFLLSAQSQAITGALIPVTGGV